MKRTAGECVTTSPDTAKTFHPCHDKGEKVIKSEEKGGDQNTQSV